MLIKDIPYPKVRAAAYRNSDDLSYEDAGSAFIWSETKEGPHFWGAVYKADWDEAKKLCPHLFEGEEVAVNVYDCLSVEVLQGMIDEIQAELDRRKKSKEIRVSMKDTHNRFWQVTCPAEDFLGSEVGEEFPWGQTFTILKIEELP